MSWLDLKYDVSLWDYMKLLSEAIYADEIEQYNEVVLQGIAFHNPKQIKKMKPADMRFAGKGSDPTKSVVAFVASKTGGDFRPNGKIEEFARATNRRVVYSNDDNFLIRDEATDNFIVAHPIGKQSFVNSVTGEIIDRRICMLIPLKNTEYNA